jgi:tetratricopeptide (TPR) repeat protein
VTAQEPPAKAEAVKPPWQRYLHGKEAQQADEQDNKLAQLRQAGKLDEALQVARDLAALRDKVQGADHWQAVDARLVVEALQRVRSATKQEQQSYARALALKVEAFALYARGRYRDAQLLLEQVLAIHRTVLGAEHPDTASCYNNVAASLDAQGKHKQAEESYRQALAIYGKVHGEEHPDTALCYSSLASSQQHQGKLTEAEEGYRKALEIYRKRVGEEHPDTARSYSSLASSQQHQGKPTEAEKRHRRALAIRRKTLGEEHPATVSSYYDLASNQQAQSKYQEAEELLRSASKAIAMARLGIAASGLERATFSSERSPPARAGCKQRAELLGQLRQAQDELADFTRQLEKKHGPIAGLVFDRNKIAQLSQGVVRGQASQAEPA